MFACFLDTGSDADTVSNAKDRGVFAAKKLMAGDVVCLERKPMFLSPNCGRADNDLKHCHHCLRATLNLLPCPTCPDAMFCTKQCMEQALSTYHKFECKSGVLAFCAKARDETMVRDLVFPLRILFSFSMQELKVGSWIKACLKDVTVRT